MQDQVSVVRNPTGRIRQRNVVMHGVIVLRSDVVIYVITRMHGWLLLQHFNDSMSDRVSDRVSDWVPDRMPHWMPDFDVWPSSRI